MLISCNTEWYVRIMCCLTPLLPVYEILMIVNPALNWNFHNTLQLHHLPGDWPSELFHQRSGKSSSFLCKTKWKVLDFTFFVDDIIYRVGF